MKLLLVKLVDAKVRRGVIALPFDGVELNQELGHIPEIDLLHFPEAFEDVLAQHVSLNLFVNKISQSDYS